MESVTDLYLTRASLSLTITLLCYFLLNGAQLFETALLVPAWSSNPPFSLQLLRDEFRIDLKTFWIVAHSVHELTFLAAVACCWRLPGIRNPLLILLAVHIAVRVWTLVYFAPNIIDFQHIANHQLSPENLAARVRAWKQWNYLRVAAFMLVSAGLLPLLWSLLRMKSPAG